MVYSGPSSPPSRFISFHSTTDSHRFLVCSVGSIQMPHRPLPSAASVLFLATHLSTTLKVHCPIFIPLNAIRAVSDKQTLSAVNTHSRLQTQLNPNIHIYYTYTRRICVHHQKYIRLITTIILLPRVSRNTECGHRRSCSPGSSLGVTTTATATRASDKKPSPSLSPIREKKKMKDEIEKRRCLRVLSLLRETEMKRKLALWLL